MILANRECKQSRQHIQHIQQTGPGLCLAACCAMLTNTSIEDVLDNVKLSQTKKGTEYLSNIEAIKYLAKYDLQYGLSIGAISTEDYIPSDLDGFYVKYTIKDRPAILSVPSPVFGDKLQHAVVYDNIRDIILDPLLTFPTKRIDYKIICWTPIADMNAIDWDV